MRQLRQWATEFAHGHDADGKDLLSQTLARVIDENDDPYRPEKSSFLAHMYVSLKRTRSRMQRGRAGKIAVSDGGAAQDDTGRDEPRADDELERVSSLAVMRMLGPQLLEKLGSDLLARRIYETAMTQDLDPAEQAALFNVTPAEIKAAHQRLKYHGKKVLDEWQASEERRMSALREQGRRAHHEHDEEDNP